MSNLRARRQAVWHNPHGAAYMPHMGFAVRGPAPAPTAGWATPPPAAPPPPVTPVNPAIVKAAEDTKSIAYKLANLTTLEKVGLASIAALIGYGLYRHFSR